MKQLFKNFTFVNPTLDPMGLVDTCCTVTYVTLYLQRAEESDSGRYTVLATNIAGEAQSIADIFVEDEVSSEEEREVYRAF